MDGEPDVGLDGRPTFLGPCTDPRYRHAPTQEDRAPVMERKPSGFSLRRHRGRWIHPLVGVCTALLALLTATSGAGMAHRAVAGADTTTPSSTTSIPPSSTTSTTVSPSDAALVGSQGTDTNLPTTTSAVTMNGRGE